MVDRNFCPCVLAAVGMMLGWAVAPLSGDQPRPLRFVMMSPHTDDAEFALGGVLALLARQGQDVTIANMSGGDSAKAISERTKKIMGVQTVEWLGFPDMAIVDTPESRARVAKYLDSKRPDVIFAPWPIDGHPDHRGTASLAIDYVNNRQINSGPGQYCPQLMFYEVMAGHQSRYFKPDTFIELPADAVEAKTRAMNAYNDGPYIDAAVKQALTMLSFRGMESGVCRWRDIEGARAEALATFPLATGQRRVQLPGQK